MYKHIFEEHIQKRLEDLLTDLLTEHLLDCLHKPQLKDRGINQPRRQILQLTSTSVIAGSSPYGDKAPAAVMIFRLTCSIIL